MKDKETNRTVIERTMTPNDLFSYSSVHNLVNFSFSVCVLMFINRSVMNINFQQNLNHYYTNSSGKLGIQFAPNSQPKESDFKFLAEINDCKFLGISIYYSPSGEISLYNTMLLWSKGLFILSCLSFFLSFLVFALLVELCTLFSFLMKHKSTQWMK